MEVDDTVDQDAADEQEILGVLEELETKFGVADHAAFNPIQILTNVYQYDAEQFSPDAAYAVYSEAATELLGIQYWVTTNGDADLQIRLACLMRAVQESYSTLVAVTSWCGGPATMSMSAEDLALRFSAGEKDKRELGIQTVYKYILVWTRRLQLRHKDDSVYCQKMTATGLPTHAWVLAKNVGGQDMSTLDKLVGAICTKSKDVNIWKMAVAVSTPALTSKLKGCIEIEFPHLVTNRAWIAFSDGLYSVYTETFVPYGELKVFGIPNNLAVCSYHRCQFAPAFYRGQSTKGIPLHPLVEVKTPLFDKILNTQELCGHTKFWTMALLGRLLYFSNVLEGWQICLMFKVSFKANLFTVPSM